MKYLTIIRPEDTCLCAISPSRTRTFLEGWGTSEKVQIGPETYNIFKCTDIRRGLNNQVEYNIDGKWYFLCKKNGEDLERDELPNILFVTFAHDICVSKCEKNQDSFRNLAEQIRESVRESNIANTIFASEIQGIREACQGICKC